MDRSWRRCCCCILYFWTSDIDAVLVATLPPRMPNTLLIPVVLLVLVLVLVLTLACAWSILEDAATHSAVIVSTFDTMAILLFKYMSE